MKLKGYKICLKNCLDYCKRAVYDKIKNTLVLTTKILRTDTTYIILSYEVILLIMLIKIKDFTQIKNKNLLFIYIMGLKMIPRYQMYYGFKVLVFSNILTRNFMKRIERILVLKLYSNKTSLRLSILSKTDK